MKFLTIKLGPIAVCVAAATVAELEEQDRQGRPGAGVGPRQPKTDGNSTQGVRNAQS